MRPGQADSMGLASAVGVEALPAPKNRSQWFMPGEHDEAPKSDRKTTAKKTTAAKKPAAKKAAAKPAAKAAPKKAAAKKGKSEKK